MTAAAAPAPARSRWLRDFLILTAIALPFVFTLGMTQGLNHDENQHIAAGALVAREGLLPYRDFPHFHTPYLAFIYAALFRATDHLLLAARLFTIACATASVGIVGAATADAFRAHSPRIARCAVAGAMVLALSSWVFTKTTGHAWNHEPPLFFALAAFFVHLAGIRRTHGGWLFASGMLLAVAIGIRLTYAPLIAPFGLATLLLIDVGLARRLALAAWFSAGVLVALSGIAWLAMLAPEAAWFGNFEFAKVNVTYRFATGEPRTMTIAKKTRYLFKSIVRPDLGLVLAFLGPLVTALTYRRTSRQPLPLELLFLLWCLPFLLLGSFAPSPVFEQYFYPFVFFLVAGAAYALAALPQASFWFRGAALVAGAGVVLSVGRGAVGYHQLPELFKPSKWTPIELHAEASHVRVVPESARVLTLAPIGVLEAGRRIYPEFVTGPFAWRVAKFVDPAKAARLKIPTPESLAEMFAADPPAALLLGAERKVEGDFQAFVRANRYRLLPGGHGEQLWVRP